MIPNRATCYSLWDYHALPEAKRHHSQIVCDLALFFVDTLARIHPEIHINKSLVEASSLLHDIDKAIPKLSGETHPDAGVRVLREKHYDEVAQVIKCHSVTSILSDSEKPNSWEEKIVFLADKMVKHSVISVDQRFALWFAESDLPQEQKDILRKCLPLVHILECEIVSLMGMSSDQLIDAYVYAYKQK